MKRYKIIRVYEVPAENYYEATDRMMEALALHVEQDYHVRDFIKDPDDKKEQARPVDLRIASWLEILKRQLGLAKK